MTCMQAHSLDGTHNKKELILKQNLLQTFLILTYIT